MKYAEICGSLNMVVILRNQNVKNQILWPHLGGDGQKSMEGEFIDLLSSIHDIILFVIILTIECF
jgi:hypothetical protein